MLKFNAFKFNTNLTPHFLKDKKTKYRLIASILILTFFLTYTLIWHLRYPILNWATYTNNNIGVDLKLPANLKITNAYNASYVHITGEQIKHPEIFTHPEDIAYQKKYSCPGMSGVCTDSIPRDFFLRITRYKPAPIIYQHLTDAYFIFNSYSIIQVDGYKAYKKENWIMVPPGLEKHITVLVVKGNQQINFDGYLPVNGRMHDRLFNQIMSTVKILL